MVNADYFKGGCIFLSDFVLLDSLHSLTFFQSDVKIKLMELTVNEKRKPPVEITNADGCKHKAKGNTECNP